MGNFYRGVFFTVGMYMFGKGMYNLGRLKEQRNAKKVLHECEEALNDMLENLKVKGQETEEA